MKRNDTHFSDPTRQSIFAIALIILKYIRVIARQIWPLLLLFLIGGGQGGRKIFLLYVVLAVAAISMIWAIIAYFKFYFFLENDELIIRKGVLRKTRLNIPFERVQSINFQQNILHRLFDVTQLDVDTAGSKGKEFSFDALSHNDARLLRDIILKQKQKRTVIAGTESENLDIPSKPILHLGIEDLLKVGVSQNHFRSGALIFVALFWVLQSLDDIGYSSSEIVEATFEKSLQASLLLVVILFVAFITVSFIVSLVRTIITYFDLTLYREPNRYKLVAGLFTKKEIAIVDRKIQILEWGDNLIQKLFKYYNVKLKQASSVEVAAKNSIQIPGCQYHHIDFIMQNWLGKVIDTNENKNPVSIHFFYRRLLYRMVFCLFVGSISFYLQNWFFFIISLLLIPYFVATSWLAFKKAGFSLVNENLYVSQGMIGDKYAIMPLYKIQSIRIRQTPYQSRHKLANLDIFSASGFISIPYIPHNLALSLHNFLSFKVLISKKKWM